MTTKEFEQLEKLVIANGGVDKTIGFEGERAVIATAQKFLKSQGFDPGVIDGYYGPRTEFAVESYYDDEDEKWIRPDEEIKTKWPSYGRLEDFFGEPGDRSNLITIDIPYPMRLAWNTKKEVTRMTCHKLVAESTIRVLNKVLDHYGIEEIQRLGLDLYGGTFNDRPMRGSNKKSTHAWGISHDFDPANNKLKWGSDRARFAKPEYDYWWQCWEEEGWVSLGRERNFDWMHIQACNI